MIQFVGDSRQVHSLYCFSTTSTGDILVDRAHIERIHKGKRAANDICSWAGHIAECRVAQRFPPSIRYVLLLFSISQLTYLKIWSSSNTCLPELLNESTIAEMIQFLDINPPSDEILLWPSNSALLSKKHQNSFNTYIWRKCLLLLL